MEDITKNEIKFLLTLFKNPKENFNARNLSKKIGLSHTGTLKIAKHLEKEEIIVSNKIGNAIIYNINKEKSFVKDYLIFLLQRESIKADAYVKRWVQELNKIESAELIILFGSVLRKHDKAKDIDVLFIVKDQKEFNKLKKEIEKINLINIKIIHPMFQTKEDIIKNIKKEDKALLSALNGVVVKGYEIFWKVLK
jgi:predicted nucleotidyltransferase